MGEYGTSLVFSAQVEKSLLMSGFFPGGVNLSDRSDSDSVGPDGFRKERSIRESTPFTSGHVTNRIVPGATERKAQFDLWTRRNQNQEFFSTVWLAIWQKQSGDMIFWFWFLVVHKSNGAKVMKFTRLLFFSSRCSQEKV